MADRDYELWELKQAAKWSLDLSERIRAIRELENNFGEDAVEALGEIKDTAVHDEIRAYCIEAIKNAGRTQVKETLIVTQSDPVSEQHQKASNPKPVAKKAPAKKKAARRRKEVQ